MFISFSHDYVEIVCNKINPYRNFCEIVYQHNNYRSGALSLMTLSYMPLTNLIE